MRGKKRHSLWKLLAAAVLYGWAVFFWGLADREGTFTQIVLEQGITVAEGVEVFSREWEAENPVGFCLWGENPRQAVSCLTTGGNAQVTQKVLVGNPELMDAGSLAWQEGCLIDGETAQTLFGTRQCGGQSLLYDGAVYPVLGTLATSRPTMVLMGQPGDETLLTHGILAIAPEMGKTLGVQCLIRWGLGGRILDVFPLLALTENFLLLFPGILLLAVWGYLGKDWRELTIGGISSKKQLPLLGKSVLALTLMLGTIWLLGTRLVVPSDMIPSRWSEFSFWGNWWEKEQENLFWICSQALENGQLQMLTNMVKSMGNSMAAAVLALWAVRRKKDADTSG